MNFFFVEQGYLSKKPKKDDIQALFIAFQDLMRIFGIYKRTALLHNDFNAAFYQSIENER